jgi:hypothetical protein
MGISSLGKITLKQRNIFAQGVIELPLHEIEKALIKSNSSYFTVKNRCGKDVEINNQTYWIVLVLYSGEHRRLTYSIFHIREVQTQIIKPL